MKSSINQMLRLLLLTIALTSPLTLTNIPSAHSEEYGTSCADCPNYSGSFSIENNTGVTITYYVRWGRKNPWKSITLESGRQMVHSYPLGENKYQKVPQPYIRFDYIAGDAAFTPKVYNMAFYATGYAGYTTADRQNTTKPKPYFFEYGSHGTRLDLYSRS